MYASAAEVRHHYRPGIKDTLRRARAYGRGNARQAATTPGVWPIVYPFPLLIAALVARGASASATGARRARAALGAVSGLGRGRGAPARSRGLALPLPSSRAGGGDHGRGGRVSHQGHEELTCPCGRRSSSSTRTIRASC